MVLNFGCPRELRENSKLAGAEHEFADLFLDRGFPEAREFASLKKWRNAITDILCRFSEINQLHANE